MERREILRYIGIASVAAGFPGFRQWMFACSADPQEHHDHEGSAAPAPAANGPYTPLFFSPPQYAMVERLTEIIIPEDDTPGAKSAGVAEFIDFMVANRVPVGGGRHVRATQDAIEMGNQAQTRFLDGLAWINARSYSEFGHEFMECSAEQQNDLLSELAYKDKFKPTTEVGRAFFQFLRDYTVVGYYTTKVGLEALGYPGLRTVWPSMPGCPHPDDPEHMHLSQPANSGTSA
jgi:hypothetical protein